MEDNSEDGSNVINYHKKKKEESCRLAETASTTKKQIKRSSTFIGVFAISRPKRASTAEQPASSAAVFPVAVQAGHEQQLHDEDDREDTTTSSSNTRKRKRTPSDGCSSQGSADSFNPDALVSTVIEQPSKHLQASIYCNDTTPLASTSRLPSFKKLASLASSISTAAPPSTTPSLLTEAVVDRKGKGRQSSIPCVEVSQQATTSSSSRSQRASSTVPLSRRDRTAASIEQRDHHAINSLGSRRAHSAIPSSSHQRGRVEDEPGEGISEEKSHTLPNFKALLARPHEDPAAGSPLLTDRKDGTTTATRQKPATSIAVMDWAALENSSNLRSKPSQPLQPEVPVTQEEEGTESQETAPSLASSTASTSTLCSQQKEDPLDLSNELVCISSSEAEEEIMLADPEEPILLPSKMRDLVSAKNIKAYRYAKEVEEKVVSPAKKSVKFAVDDARNDRRREREHERRQSKNDEIVDSRRKSSSAPPVTKRKRASQEYFAGEAEDYKPSSEEEDSPRRRLRESSSSQETTVRESIEGFGSSPLTPLTSSNSRNTAARSGRRAVETTTTTGPNLLSLLSSSVGIVASERPGSVRSSNSNNRPSSSQSNRVNKRRITYSDDTDEDGEVPLRKLGSPRTSSARPESTTKLSRSSSLTSQPVTRPRKATKSASLASIPLTQQDAQPSRTLFTRSRATGESADCRQCHRCETYQARSKTLRCMTCELAVCTTCLDAYYAGHPSYAATLAYMRGTGLDADVSEIDFKCPVCKCLCRCPVCLRGPFPKAVTTTTLPQAMPPRAVSLEQSDSMRRSESLLSSDADLEPLHWPTLSRGTSTRPNLKVRLRVARPSAINRLSKSAQQRSCSVSNAYHDLQDAIAGEAARRAQVDAETDFVPNVSSRQSRKATTITSSHQPEQIYESGQHSASASLSPSSDSDDAVLVATSRRPRPTRSGRVKLATKVGQQLGKSPAYTESRRGPRREGDQLIPYNADEPVLTLGPEVVDHEDDDFAKSYVDGGMAVEAIVDTLEMSASTQETSDLEDHSNELLASLLVLPEDDETVEEDPVDIPSLDDHPSAGIDYMSPSDTGTTASVSSIASPPPTEDRTVRFELPNDNLSTLHSLHTDHTLSSIFLPGIEDDFAFPVSSPTSTPTIKSRFLQNPPSSTSISKAFSGLSSFSASYSGHQDSSDSLLHGSPSRHTAFDMDLMPEWTFDHYIRT